VIADDAIINWIQSVHPIKVLVVTTDRGLGIRTLELGSYTMRNGEYRPKEDGDRLNYYA
jgi:hypothetical protein